MEYNDGLRFVNELLSQKHQQVLNDLETEIFKGCWLGKTYDEIAKESHKTEQYIRETAGKIFKKVESVLAIKINKKNFISSIEHKYQEYHKNFHQPDDDINTQKEFPNPPIPNQIINPFIPQAGKIADPQLFFARQRELNLIFEHLNNSSNVALIGAEGVGKSSLLWATCHHSRSKLYSPRQAIFIDLHEIDNSEEDFYDALCDEIGIPKSRGAKLTRNLRDKRILLALDNVGNLAQIISNLFMPV